MQNLLPYDGEVYYLENVFSEKKAGHHFHELKESILWEHDEGVMFGKPYITDRKVAWYGDESFPYNYSKNTKHAHPWTNILLTIKDEIENVAYATFNSCLLNYYHSGQEGMGWHSDNEKEMLPKGTIASVSLGADRKFVFKHKSTKEKVELVLKNGSVLLMKGDIQIYWWHSLPKSKKVLLPRINLTFRTFVA